MKTVSIILLTLGLVCMPARSQDAAPSQGKYAVAGLNNDREVEQFFMSFKEAVAKGDKQAVAAMVRYPIKVALARGRQVTLRSKVMFLRNYDAIFNEPFKQAIAQTKVEDLWAKWSGVATPRGEVWMSGIIKNPKKPEIYELKIITLNGPVERKK